MKKGILTALLMSGLLLLPGCQSNQSSPLPIPKDAVMSLTMTASSQTFYVGTSEIFNATATMFDGSTKAITGGVWSSDVPSVATVEASTGKVAFVGEGWVLISVDYEGKSACDFFEAVPKPRDL